VLKRLGYSALHRKVVHRRRLRLDRPFGTQENVHMAESFSAKLAGITLPDLEGKSTRLGSLWESGPAVLVFLRHYG
jgi:hypothetical protein